MIFFNHKTVAYKLGRTLCTIHLTIHHPPPTFNYLSCLPNTTPTFLLLIIVWTRETASRPNVCAAHWPSPRSPFPHLVFLSLLDVWIGGDNELRSKSKVGISPTTLLPPFFQCHHFLSDYHSKGYQPGPTPQLGLRWFFHQPGPWPRLGRLSASCRDLQGSLPRW
jgi:hypothetical protein